MISKQSRLTHFEHRVTVPANTPGTLAATGRSLRRNVQATVPDFFWLRSRCAGVGIGPTTAVHQLTVSLTNCARPDL